MKKFTDSLADIRQGYRAYNKSNRSDWADLGFRYVTVLVHDDERLLVLAELEVRKAAAMVAMAENTATSAEVLRLLSRRNMTPLPLPGDFAALLTTAAESTARVAIEGAVDIAKNYAKRYRGIEASYNKADSDDKRVRMAAKAVSYSGACAAHMRMATSLMDFEPLRKKSIFGMVEAAE